MGMFMRLNTCTFMRLDACMCIVAAPLVRPTRPPNSPCDRRAIAVRDHAAAHTRTLTHPLGRCGDPDGEGDGRGRGREGSGWVGFGAEGRGRGAGLPWTTRPTQRPTAVAKQPPMADLTHSIYTPPLQVEDLEGKNDVREVVDDGW